MHYNSLSEKEMKKLEDYEKKVSWPILLALITCIILAYQLIYNVLFSDIIYNPALGDEPVQVENSRVISWKEGGDGVLNAVEDVPGFAGVNLPHICFVCVIVGLGMAAYNVRKYLLKKYEEKVKNSAKG